MSNYVGKMKERQDAGANILFFQTQFWAIYPEDMLHSCSHPGMRLPAPKQFLRFPYQSVEHLRKKETLAPAEMSSATTEAVRHVWLQQQRGYRTAISGCQYGALHSPTDGNRKQELLEDLLTLSSTILCQLVKYQAKGDEIGGTCSRQKN
jgi:hypothetical protein